MQLVTTTDRSAVGEMLKLEEFVDVIVPRGGKGLIERVSRETRIPVIKHWMASAMCTLMLMWMCKRY